MSTRANIILRDAKTKAYLRSLSFLEEIKESRKVYFQLKGATSPDLFSNHNTS